MHEFNTEHPHEALAMKPPADIHAASARAYQGLPEIDYPLHDRDALVTACGRICMQRKKINISTVMAGQRLGLKEVDDGIWVVSFMAYDLGYITIRSLHGCYPCLRYEPLPMCPGWTHDILAPRVGFEPTTSRLTAGCSTAELPRNSRYGREARV